MRISQPSVTQHHGKFHQQRKRPIANAVETMILRSVSRITRNIADLRTAAVKNVASYLKSLDIRMNRETRESQKLRRKLRWLLHLFLEETKITMEFSKHQQVIIPWPTHRRILDWRVQIVQNKLWSLLYKFFNLWNFNNNDEWIHQDLIDLSSPCYKI